MNKSIGQYEIIEELGEGGMSTVYKAQDQNLNRIVALKLLSAIMQYDPDSLKRFRQEAQITANLSHANIVPTYDFGDDGRVSYIVMQYLGNGSLQTRIKAGRVGLETVVIILQQIASAIDYAHSEGVIHRDIKPSNILFDTQNNPYLTDFGIGKMMSGGMTITNTGVSLGTPAYMSPEAIDNDLELDGRADVYSLGIILYEMLSGTPPFTGESIGRVMIGHLTDPIPDIRLVRPDLPYAVTRVIERALAKAPADRYQTAGEFARDFDVAISTQLDVGAAGIETISQKDQIFDYLKDLGKGTYARYEAKLLIVGEGSVGKSSLLRALQGKGFIQGLKTTHGVDVEPYRFPHPTKQEAIITLNVWDFGGQQIYHTTHQFFMTPRSLYLLVWNARGDTDQARLDHWLRNIQILAPEAPVLLVATHVEGRPLDFNYGRYKESYPQIVGYQGISSRDGTGIEELKELIAQEAAGLDLMGQQWPENWVKAELALSEIDAYYLSAEDYLQTCLDNGVSPEVAQTTLGSYLHDLGKLLYYHDDIALADFIVLQPNWLTQAISRVLDDEIIKNDDGILNHSDFSRIWEQDEEGRPYGRHLYARFLRLMERFLISFRLESDRVGQPASQSLIPVRLNHAPPAMPVWKEVLPGQPEIAMVFRMQNFVPPGIMSWFIVLTHAYSQNFNWRDGVRLYYKGHQAEAVLNLSKRELWLRVKGPAPHNLFNILQHTIQDRIMEQYFIGLVYKREVPCNCHFLTGETTPCLYFHNYQRLVTRREKGKLVAECDESFEEVSVIELLEGIHYSSHNQVAVKLEETKLALDEFNRNQQRGMQKGQQSYSFPEQANLSQEPLIQLMTILSERFSGEELHTFSYSLGVDYENLEAKGKANKARELVQYCERHNKLMDILRVGEERRPDIAWRAFFQEAAGPEPQEVATGLIDQNRLLLRQNTQYFEQLNRNFTRFWNYQLKNIGVEFPSTFVLTPHSQPPFNREVLLNTEYSLHLLCQYPASPHIARSEDSYELKELKIDLNRLKGVDKNEAELSTLQAWFIRIAPWLKQLYDFLGYIPQKGFDDDMDPDFIKQIKLNTRVIEAVFQYFDQPPEDILIVKEPYAAESQALQVLYNFFRQAEKKERWSGLKKVVTNDGNIFWLCEQHSKLYETL